MNLAAIQRGHLHAAEKASEALLVTALQCERTFSKKVCAKLTSPLRRRLRQDSDGRDYASHTEPKGEYHDISKLHRGTVALPQQPPLPRVGIAESRWRCSPQRRQPAGRQLPPILPQLHSFTGLLSADLECSCYDESGNLQDTYLFAAPFCLGRV